MQTIIILDDIEYDRILYKAYLEDNDYSFSICESEQCFKEQLHESNPDLIILKWKSRKVDGERILKESIHLLSQMGTPVIVIGDESELLNSSNLLSHEMIDVLIKPITKFELQFKVAKCLKLKKYFV